AATEGFAYASFLAGQTNAGYISATVAQQYSDKSFAWYVQDSWKVTRKLTLDYGLRYDFQTYMKERDGLQQNVAFYTPNPAAGGQPGGTIFEGYAPGHCNCECSHSYPCAFQPRLGLAYPIHSNTVLRAGRAIT